MKWQLFLLVGGGVFICTMDSSMINVALPSVMRAFSVPLIQVQWVVLLYLLAITVSLLFWGIGVSRIGTGRTFLLGLVIFTCGSVCCAAAGTFLLLLAMRLVEGTGAAMMMAAGPALIRQVFPRSEIGRGLGFVGIATSAGLLSGPAVSGVLIEYVSWRFIFLVGLPFSLVLMVLGVRVFRRIGPGGQTSRTYRFDLKGALSWALLVISFVLYGHFIGELSWLLRLLGAAGLLVLLTGFIVIERSPSSGILPLHLFRERYFLVGLITASVSFGSLFVVLVLMPFYLDYVRQLSADVIGLVMMSVPLTLCVVSPLAGYLFDRWGGRWLTTGGLSVCLAALLMLAWIGPASSLVSICIVLAVLGMGQSMFLAPNTASLLSRSDDDDAGITSGLLATARNLGMLTGAACAGIIFAGWFSLFSGGGELRDYVNAQQHAFMLSFRATLLCAALVSCAAVVMSWQRGRS